MIESCCTTLEQALSAQTRGAGRIELCADLSVGGVTPPRNLIAAVVHALTIPVNVLIRPQKAARSGRYFGPRAFFCERNEKAEPRSERNENQSREASDNSRQ